MAVPPRPIANGRGSGIARIGSWAMFEEIMAEEPRPKKNPAPGAGLSGQ